MIGIDAAGYVAGMHDRLSRLDGALGQHIAHTVRVGRELLAAHVPAEIDHPVATWIPPRRPQPAAARGLVFRVETCYESGGQIPPPQALRERLGLHSIPRHCVSRAHVSRRWIIR